MDGYSYPRHWLTSSQWHPAIYPKKRLSLGNTTHEKYPYLTDGIFPLVTNVEEFSEREVLDAYKKQPLVEKRFEQLKTDFDVAPVYLKEVRRIQALLCVYFFVLLAEALLERELRRAMHREGIKSLPMYPEGRPCRRPTARRLIDLFGNVQRHALTTNKRCDTVFVTDLSTLQCRILKLFRLPANSYGH